MCSLKFERLALCASGFFSAASVRGADTLIPVFANEFGVSIGTAGTLLTGFMLAYGLMQWVYGPLAQHNGTLRVIIYALLLSAIMNFGVALSESYGMLFIFRTLSGASAAGIVPLCLARIADTEPLFTRQATIARFSLAPITGLMCGQWMAGVMAHHYSWRITFLILSCGFLVSIAVLFKFSNESSKSDASKGLISFKYVRMALKTKAATVTLLLTALLGILGPGVLSFVAANLKHSLQVSLSDIGLLTASIGAGGLIYAILAPTILKHFRPPVLAFAACTSLSLSLVAFSLINHPWQAALACFFAGLGYYATLNILQTVATEFAPELKPTAVTLFASCLFCTQAFAVMGWGAMVDRYGFATIFVCGGCGALVLGILLRNYLLADSPLSGQPA